MNKVEFVRWSDTGIGVECKGGSGSILIGRPQMDFFCMGKQFDSDELRAIADKLDSLSPVVGEGRTGK